MSDQRDSMISSAVAGFEMTLAAVYEAGRQAGRQEAAAEFKEKIAGLLDIGSKPGGPSASASAVVSDLSPQARATPGSVKPVILKIINESYGVTLAEIQEATGIKYNSVRGTLWQLQKEGAILRRGDSFVAAPRTNEAVDDSQPGSASTASISNPAQGREAGPGGGT